MWDGGEGGEGGDGGPTNLQHQALGELEAPLRARVELLAADRRLRLHRRHRRRHRRRLRRELLDLLEIVDLLRVGELGVHGGELPLSLHPLALAALGGRRLFGVDPLVDLRLERVLDLADELEHEALERGALAVAVGGAARRRERAHRRRQRVVGGGEALEEALELPLERLAAVLVRHVEERRRVEELGERERAARAARRLAALRRRRLRQRGAKVGELGEGVVERRLPRRLGREPLEVDAQREERLGREGAPAGGGGGDERRGAALADERRVGVEEGAERERGGLLVRRDVERLEQRVRVLPLLAQPLRGELRRRRRHLGVAVLEPGREQRRALRDLEPLHLRLRLEEAERVDAHLRWGAQAVV